MALATDPGEGASQVAFEPLDLFETLVGFGPHPQCPFSRTLGQLFQVSWRGDFVGQVGGSQGPEVFHVERVDAIALRFLRAAQMDGVMNPASGPAIDSAVANDFPILRWGESDEFQVRENHPLDNLPRFAGVKWRLERRSGQDRIDLGQAMGADKSAMLSADQFFKNGESRGVVRVPLHSCRDEHGGIKILIHRPHALRVRSSRSSSIALSMS